MIAVAVLLSATPKRTLSGTINLMDIYPFHPFTVHFPIALLLVSGLFTWLFLRSRTPSWETSAYHCLLVGWLSSVVAILTGLTEAALRLTGPEAGRAPDLVQWVNAHAAFSILATIVYGQALLLRRRQPAWANEPRQRRLYLRFHIIGAGLLVIGGWLGARLTYWLGLGVAT